MSRIPIVKMPPKQPYEVVPYSVDMRRWMAKGEKVASVAARIYLKGTDPEVENVDAMLYSTAHDGGTVVQVRVQDGDPDAPSEPLSGVYRVRLRVQTVAGSRYEAEIEFQVVEVY